MLLCVLWAVIWTLCGCVRGGRSIKRAVPLPGLHFSCSVLLPQLTEALQEQVGVELLNHLLWILRSSVEPYF